MSFEVYRKGKFKSQHERAFFEKFAEELSGQYHDKTGLHTLLGNVTINDAKNECQLDAVFISRHSLVIIEFKYWKGRVKYNNRGAEHPWTVDGEVMTYNDKLVENPLFQVKRQKVALGSLLRSSGPQIHGSGSSTNYPWNEIISGVVLFHKGSIEFNKEDIEDPESKWFHVTDCDKACALLQTITNEPRSLSDKQIRTIMRILKFGENDLVNLNTKAKPSHIKEADNPSLSSVPFFKAYYTALVNALPRTGDWDKDKPFGDAQRNYVGWTIRLTHGHKADIYAGFTVRPRGQNVNIHITGEHSLETCAQVEKKVKSHLNFNAKIDRVRVEEKRNKDGHRLIIHRVLDEGPNKDSVKSDFSDEQQRAMVNWHQQKLILLSKLA